MTTLVGGLLCGLLKKSKVRYGGPFPQTICAASEGGRLNVRKPYSLSKCMLPCSPGPEVGKCMEILSQVLALG